MGIRLLACAAILVLVSLDTAAAQEEIPLWPNGAPGSPEEFGEVTVTEAPGGEHVLSNIHKPTLTAYLPAADVATGAAMIVAPGGGHRELWVDHEGHHVAKWLSEHGVAAFVLKYRLANAENSPYSVDEHAVADAHRAVRLVRSNAEKWNIDPQRVGIMGFSAGGEVAAMACQLPAANSPGASDSVDNENPRPDFQVLVYAGRSNRIEPTSDSPPVLIICGYGDRPDISEGMAHVYLKFKKQGVPAELHIYSEAGHGFGLRARNAGAVAQWPERLLEWMGDRGLLDKS